MKRLLLRFRGDFGRVLCFRVCGVNVVGLAMPDFQG